MAGPQTDSNATVLILAPADGDAQTMVRLLTRHGTACEICDDMRALAAGVGERAGAVLITEEALLHADPSLLTAALRTQPDWSDLPFVFLCRRRPQAEPDLSESRIDQDPSAVVARLPPQVTNVMLLERPLGTRSLLSAIDWALRSRRRQFLIRDQIDALNRQAALLKRHEEALEENRGYLRDLLDSAQEGFYAIDRDGVTTVCNAAFRRMLGFDHETEIVGRAMHDVIHHSHRDGSHYPADGCPIYRTAHDGTPCHVTDELFYRRDGTGFPVDYRAQPVYRRGELVGAVCTFSDITESLLTERALRTANERFALVLNSGAIVGSWIWDVQADRITGDERFAQAFCLDPQRLQAGLALSEVMTAIHPDDHVTANGLIRQALAQGGPYRAEYRIRQPGGWRWIEANGRVSFGADGRPERFPGVLIDISERKRIEAALRASDLELRLVADSLPFMIAFVDRTLVYRFANLAYKDWFGLHPQDVVGSHVRDIVGDAGFALRKSSIDRALAGETVSLELPWPHADGRRREAEVRYMPRLDQDGTVLGFHVFVHDVTERALSAEALKGAAEALERRVAQRTSALVAEIADRQKAEEALRQFQKMEAVGQLTAGIAHDFNNMLTGIIGSIELMRRRIASGRFTGLERFMDAAEASASRAAALTHRLLAFSRRQSLDTRAIDVNALVGSLEDLLSRTIGEQVALRVRLADGLPLARTDANQLENALLNLAINARDAMPDGGVLTIGTTAERQDEDDAAAGPIGERLPVGDYVMVSVSDTGLGMAADVLARAFEPFYTTKPLGQGTGLGLSMIYGFARQSGGSVRILSNPGEGTVVRLWLPAAHAVPPHLALHLVPGHRSAGHAAHGAGRPSTARDLPQHDTEPPRATGETVLVVEDDPAVRLLVLEVLRELGYDAIEAADAQAALPVLDSARRIDLLVSDVGLPGMNGRQLAEIARQTRPELPVLFMTGYAENATIRSGFLAEGMQMVTKPFALDGMARRIREMIES